MAIVLVREPADRGDQFAGAAKAAAAKAAFRERREPPLDQGER